MYGMCINSWIERVVSLGDELRACWYMERKVICYQLELENNLTSKRQQVIFPTQVITFLSMYAAAN